MPIEATPRQDFDDWYLTPAEVAQMLRKSVETLANERSRGEGLPYIKSGGKVLYRSADVLEALNGSTHGFSWARLEASLARYGLAGRDLDRLMEHLRRDM